MTKMLPILISHETLEVQNQQVFIEKIKIKSSSRPHYSFANFPPFVFIFFLSVSVSLCFCHIVLFWKANPTKNISSNIHADKKKKM